MSGERFTRCCAVPVVFAVLVISGGLGFAQDVADTQDPGWPRLYTQDSINVTLYQPQVNQWPNYENIVLRSAIAVVPSEGAPETYGVADIAGATDIDYVARTVTVKNTTWTFRFPTVSGSDADVLQNAAQKAIPADEELTVSLDRLLAYMSGSAQVQPSADVNLSPPTIYYSSKPAILVVFIGAPEFKPVAEGSKLLFAVNTNWDMLYDSETSDYYLRNGKQWLSGPDPIKGPWQSVSSLPAEFSSIPDDDNWADVRASLDVEPTVETPVVFATTDPSELIVTQGEPTYSPIPGTRLMLVKNTDSSLFYHSGEKDFYFLVAGRWYRAASLDGPWSSATTDLPADFAQIPDDNPAAYVKDSVKGTRQAEDAVLLASVPRVNTVRRDDPEVVPDVTYDGNPRFILIRDTPVRYAINSPCDVFLVDDAYYCCYQAVWFTSDLPSGPWMLCTSVPRAIYAIPSTFPAYNVTYVTVRDYTPTYVNYCYTSGYEGCYIDSGVLVFGAGIFIRFAFSDDWDDNCWRWHYRYHCHPSYYSWGCHATYRHRYGGFVSEARRYGPYGGAGRIAYFDWHSGHYTRGAYRYGSTRGDILRSPYDPYVDTYSARIGIRAPYGSGGRFFSYRNREALWGHGVPPAVSERPEFEHRDRRGEGEGGSSRVRPVVEGGRRDDTIVGRDDRVYRRDQYGDWTVRDGTQWTKVPGGRGSLPEGGGRSRDDGERRALDRARGRDVQMGTEASSAHGVRIEPREGERAPSVLVGPERGRREPPSEGVGPVEGTRVETPERGGDRQRPAVEIQPVPERGARLRDRGPSVEGSRIEVPDRVRETQRPAVEVQPAPEREMPSRGGRREAASEAPAAQGSGSWDGIHSELDRTERSRDWGNQRASEVRGGESGGARGGESAGDSGGARDSDSGGGRGGDSGGGHGGDSGGRRR